MDNTAKYYVENSDLTPNPEIRTYTTGGTHKRAEFPPNQFINLAQPIKAIEYYESGTIKRIEYYENPVDPTPRIHWR